MNKQPIKAVILLTLSLWISPLWNSQATETSTNWTWAEYSLIMPHTNFIFGDKIAVRVVVSNTIDKEQIFYYIEPNSCECGPGKFKILEISSGKEIKCKRSLSERAGSVATEFDYLQGHQARAFEAELASGYAITNAGAYSVQAVGRFALNIPPTNHQYATLSTPPIIINVATKAETNSLAK